MPIPFVDLVKQYDLIKEEIDVAIQNVIHDAQFIGGPHVEQFEHQFAVFNGVQFCTSCANGTDALEIALESLGVGIGDEVIVPAYTWISTANCVARVGAKPVFVDLDPKTYTLDPSKIEDSISSKTKAIIPVHFYGLPANMLEIMPLAERHNLYIIEDCAQAHGATINDKKVGTFGHFGAFSFYPGKNLGAYGDGGALITNDSALAETAKIIAKQGQQGKHNHLRIGRNSRLDGLQAAILNVKLKYLNDWIAGRRAVASCYEQRLKRLPIITQSVPKGFEHVYHLFVIQTDQRDELRAYLSKHEISTVIHYPKPLNQLDIFDRIACPVSDRMSDRILSLPMYPELKKDQVDFICDRIEDFVS